MKIKIKKLKDSAVIPCYAKEGDAGMDLTANSIKSEGDYISYGTGLAVEIPSGYVGLLFPRSSIWKTGMMLSNCVGVIDSGYRGEIMAKFYAPKGPLYAQGDRFAQLIIMPYPQIEFELVTELAESERGEGGYGSTGS